MSLCVCGSVIFRCAHCSKLYQVPRSCGNRHCPTCQGAKAKAWLIEQQARLLPCAYFMLTFTVPAEFRAFMRSHPRECYQAIFQAAYQSLLQLARDPKYIGSDRLGMTGVLHTWGRDLNYHPHVHFIVPVVPSAHRAHSGYQAELTFWFQSWRFRRSIAKSSKNS